MTSVVVLKLIVIVISPFDTKATLERNRLKFFVAFFRQKMQTENAPTRNLRLNKPIYVN